MTTHIKDNSLSLSSSTNNLLPFLPFFFSTHVPPWSQEVDSSLLRNDTEMLFVLLAICEANQPIS